MDLQQVYINTYTATLQTLLKNLKEKEKSESLQNLPDALPSEQV